MGNRASGEFMERVQSPMRLVALLAPRLKRYLGLWICRVMSRPLGGVAPGAHNPQVANRLMTEAEMLGYCDDCELELTPEKVRSAFGRGALCVGALHDDALLGYIWLAFGSTPHVGGVWVDFPPDARYSYKSFVRPLWRGRRIAAGLAAHADELCLKRGRTRTVAFIELHNYASIRSAERMGTKTVGFAGYLICLGMVLAFHSPGARRFGFRFHKPKADADAGAEPFLAAGPRARKAGSIGP
jgi:GNAT superfamily N-acetyltransferase